MSDISRKALIDKAKQIYEAWNWDMLEAEMESGYDRGAFRDLVEMYKRMVDTLDIPSTESEGEADNHLQFPRQKNKRNGWTISTSYIKQIEEQILKQETESVGWDKIESVLLAVEALSSHREGTEES